MPLPFLKIQEIGHVPAGLGVSLRDAFLGPGGVIHIGCQSTSWQGDFTEAGGCWSRWKGRWNPVNGAPNRSVPQDLSLYVSGVATTIDETGVYPVASLATATAFEARCTIQDGGSVASGHVEMVLYSAATGAQLQTVTSDADPAGVNIAAFTALAAGSYQLCARVAGVVAPALSKEMYQQLVGEAVASEFFYQEDGKTWFWDWKRNLGRKPLDSENPLYALRAALVENGEQLDRPEWTTYISSGVPDDGEWSFLRVKVGGGAWTVAADVFPNPGPAMRKRGVTPTAWPGVAFDSMARCVSASMRVFWGNGLSDNALNTKEGDLLLGGTLATRTGLVAGLWRYRAAGGGAGYTLLGYHRDPSDGRCQCAKRNHGPNTLIELRDGTILILSECALLQYKPSGADVSTRIVNYPDETRETPGGYSLRLLDGAHKFNHFTENFAPPSHVLGEFNFYNRVQEIVAGRFNIGPGTRWHGRECSAAHAGYCYGWSQDGQSDSNSQQWLSRLVGGSWVRDYLDSYPAKDYLWRQVVNAQGKLICAGTRILSGANVAQEFETGKRAQPVWGVGDVLGWQEFDSPFIPLYLTVVEQLQTQFIVGIARKVSDEDELLEDEYIVQIGGPDEPEIGHTPSVCVEYSPEEGGFGGFVFPKADLIAAGIDPDLLPPYLVWNPSDAFDGGGYWTRGEGEVPDVTGTDLILLVKEENELDVIYTPVCDGTVTTAFLLQQSGDYVLQEDEDSRIALELSGGGSDGCLPYDWHIWGVLCFPGGPPGGGGNGGNGPFYPKPPCATAECVSFPACTEAKYLKFDAMTTPWEAVEVGDTNVLAHATYGSLRKLERFGASYPNLWARIDSDADVDDLSTYTLRLPWSKIISLPVPARRHIEIMVFWSCDLSPVVAPAVDRRA